MSEVLALAAQDESGNCRKHTITRREPGEKDVVIDIQYCGICHSDLHTARNEWGGTTYPCVPGHEMAGVVRSIGSGVTKFAVGDRVGVGCFVDSCRECPQCREGDEQYCTGSPGLRFSYNSTDIDGGNTYGGYSQMIVCDENYVLSIPDSLNMAEAAPLLCAGITLYSPLNYYGAKAAGSNWTVGILGLGGLGHMGVKIANAMGNRVVVFSSSPAKAAKAIEMGATSFINHRDDAEMAQHAGEIDMIIDTVSASHDVMRFLPLLRPSGKMILVGAPPEPFPVKASTIFFRRITLAGSLIGGIRETQEMLDFCAEHGLSADVDVIHPREVNRAYDALAHNKHTESRFVIDIANGLQEGDWEVEDPEPEAEAASAATDEADGESTAAAAASNK